MVLLFPWAIEYAGDALVLAAATAAHSASVPVSLRLGHAQTPALVRRAAGIPAEAEPGLIEGGEDGGAETADLEGLLTTPEQAEEFVATGIEMLAPAFGNVHGEYGPRGIQLEYDRLQSIIDAVVTKVNIIKGMNNHYADVQDEMRGKPLTSVIEAGTKRMQEAIERYMHWLGSAGKA